MCSGMYSQILAHHPDFPMRQDEAEAGPSVYQPFTRMAQFALEPLILACTSEPPGASWPCNKSRPLSLNAPS